MKLVLHSRPREKRPPGDHFIKDAAYTPEHKQDATCKKTQKAKRENGARLQWVGLHSPHVDGCGVLGGAQEHVGGPVP